MLQDERVSAPDLASQGSIDKSSSCSTDNGRPTAAVDALQQWIRGGHSHFQIPLCFLLLLYTLTVVVAPIVYIALRLPSYSEVPFVIRLFCWAAFLGGGLAPWTLLLDQTFYGDPNKSTRTRIKCGLQMALLSFLVGFMGLAFAVVGTGGTEGLTSRECGLIILAVIGSYTFWVVTSIPLAVYLYETPGRLFDANAAQGCQAGDSCKVVQCCLVRSANHGVIPGKMDRTHAWYAYRGVEHQVPALNCWGVEPLTDTLLPEGSPRPSHNHGEERVILGHDQPNNQHRLPRRRRSFPKRELWAAVAIDTPHGNIPGKVLPDGQCHYTFDGVVFWSQHYRYVGRAQSSESPGDCETGAGKENS